MRRMKPGTPCCNCPVWHDLLNRSTIGGSYDKVGNITISPNSLGPLGTLTFLWESSHHSPRLQWHGPAPDRFWASASVIPAEVGVSGYLVWQVAGGSHVSDKRYGVKITLAAAPDCGTMELVEFEDLTSPMTLKGPIPVPGFNRTEGDFAQAFVDLAFCYNVDNRVLSANIATYKRHIDEEGNNRVIPTGKNYWIHKGAIDPSQTPYTDSEIWMMADLPSSSDFAIFRDFRVGRTKHLATEDYYYYHTPADLCPCCGKCEDFAILFPDDDDGYYGYDESSETDTDVIDCQLETDGEAEDGVLKLTDGQGATYKGDWAGVNEKCEADESRGLINSFAVLPDDYGTKITMADGDISATLTLNSAADTADGKLELSTGEHADDIDAPPGVPYVFAVGAIAGEFVAGAQGVILSHSNEGNTSDVLSTHVTGGDMNVTSLRFMSCISTANFEAFVHEGLGFPHGTPTLVSCGPCRPTSGELPDSLLALIEGTDTDLDGTHILDWQNPPDISGVCQWKAEWRVPEDATDFDPYTEFSISVVIGVDGTTGNTFISTFMNITTHGGELTSHSGAAFGADGPPVGEDGFIDCHELMGLIQAFQFTFDPAPGFWATTTIVVSD